METKIKKEIEDGLEEIAKEALFLDTLETRNMDDLDFHDISVWRIKRALFKAYQLGNQNKKGES